MLLVSLSFFFFIPGGGSGGGVAYGSLMTPDLPGSGGGGTGGAGGGYLHIIVGKVVFEHTLYSFKEGGECGEGLGRLLMNIHI